jgi:hypothetical protein
MSALDDCLAEIQSNLTGGALTIFLDYMGDLGQGGDVLKTAQEYLRLLDSITQMQGVISAKQILKDGLDSALIELNAIISGLALPCLEIETLRDQMTTKASDLGTEIIDLTNAEVTLSSQGTQLEAKATALADEHLANLPIRDYFGL